jgi:hypothetical protein
MPLRSLLRARAWMLRALRAWMTLRMVLVVRAWMPRPVPSPRARMLRPLPLTRAWMLRPIPLTRAWMLRPFPLIRASTLRPVRLTRVRSSMLGRWMNRLGPRRIRRKREPRRSCAQPITLTATAARRMGASPGWIAQTTAVAAAPPVARLKRLHVPKRVARTRAPTPRKVWTGSGWSCHVWA